MVKSLTKYNSLNILKKGVWLFIFLLIFEGALRKWFLPSLATPLLVVRDPIAILLIILAWKKGIYKVNTYIGLVSFVGILSFFMTIFLGHGNILISVYGLRILLVYFPLIFVIGSIFNKDDVIQVGRVIMFISILMLVVNMFQYFSPQSAWINRAVGGEMSGSGFGGAMGFYRSSGTFSFANGNALFWGITGAFLFYFWLVPTKISQWLLIISSIVFFIAIPFSISRTVFFQALLSFVFVCIVLLKKPKYLWRLLISIFVILIIIAVFAQTSLFKFGIEVFLTRFNSANQTEGGVDGVLIDRFLGGMYRALTESENLPFWGYGLGIGTNMASVFLSGERTFFLGEAEWGRLIGEMGFLLGFIVILVRGVLTIKMGYYSLKVLSVGNPLPWMLLSFGGLIVFQGQWAQPTALGFSSLVGGLILASMSNDLKKKEL